MHPAKDGFAALPFFDDFDLSTVDILLISQYVHPPLHVRFIGATTPLVSHAQMDIQTDIQTFFSLPFLHVQTCTMRYSMQFKFLLASTIWCLPSYPNVFVLYSIVNFIPLAQYFHNPKRDQAANLWQFSFGPLWVAALCP